MHEIHGIKDVFAHALQITSFVFAMMVLVDYLNVITKGKMSKLIRGKGFRQYVVSSFLGATPGCLGAFMDVSFYVRGLISFGAVAGGMIATCGDEAFVMLAMFPSKAALLFAILFVVGVASSWIIDKTVQVLKIKLSGGCGHATLHEIDLRSSFGAKRVFYNLKKITPVRFLLLLLLGIFLYAFIFGIIGPHDWSWTRVTFIAIITLTLFIVLTVPDHYLKAHIWEHITKRHLWRILAWTFGTMLVVHYGMEAVDVATFIGNHMVIVLLLAALVGFVPESGPHLIFVVMYANGLIPFSVLLTSSIVQDGHGMLPLLSHSVKDSVLIKIFNFIIGLSLGLILFLAGV